jgi:putative phosphoesterase
MKIGLLSDTHGYLDLRLFDLFNEVDEIWHAGDIGSIEIADQLSAFKYLRAVSGNIDGNDIRQQYPKFQVFECEKVNVWMTHTCGRPGKYERDIIKMLENGPPKLLICGHSHILKVMYDRKYYMMYMNPGAAGQSGTHHIRTVLRFIIEGINIRDLEVIELGTKVKK